MASSRPTPTHERRDETARGKNGGDGAHFGHGTRDFGFDRRAPSERLDRAAINAIGHLDVQWVPHAADVPEMGGPQGDRMRTIHPLLMRRPSAAGGPD